MKKLNAVGLIAVVIFLAQTTGFAQDKPKPDDTFSKLLSFSAPAENHLLLGQLAGDWNFQDTKLAFVKGTLSRKPIYNGRFFQVEVTGGRLKVPVAGGQMKEENYQSLQIEGYDNPRKKFVMTSINNHIGSDIQEQSGKYEPNKKRFIFTWEDLLIPGSPVSNKRIVTITDKDHYKEEYYEVRNGKDVKVRELDYERISH